MGTYYRSREAKVGHFFRASIREPDVSCQLGAVFIRCRAATSQTSLRSNEETLTSELSSRPQQLASVARSVSHTAPRTRTD